MISWAKPTVVAFVLAAQLKGPVFDLLRFWNAFTAMGLPDWLFPVANIAEGRTDPVATWFYTRVPRGERIPWSAWIIPLLAWGVFAAAMLATLVAIARMLLPSEAEHADSIGVYFEARRLAPDDQRAVHGGQRRRARRYTHAGRQWR